MDLSLPTGYELMAVLGPAVVILLFWVATRRAVRDAAPMLRDALLGLVALLVAGGLVAGAL